jgi:hypothetical protein
MKEAIMTISNTFRKALQNPNFIATLIVSLLLAASSPSAADFTVICPGGGPGAYPRSIVLAAKGIRIVDLQINSPDVADFLSAVAPEEVEATLVRAIEVGVFCLQRAHKPRYRIRAEAS